MGIPFRSDTNFVDGAELSFGDSSDLKIYHSGSHSYIADVGTGNLLISGTNLWLSDAATGENFLRATSNGAVQIYYDGAFKFATTSTGVDVNGTINLDNLTINSAQGTDGQVLTSTGTGIAWEDVAGGSASLSGGEASKVAVWSATDTLTHHDDFHFDTTNVRLGIGTTAPATKLEIVDDLSAASTVEYALTLSVKDDNNSINQLGGEGVGIKFKIAGNDATDPGNTFIGAGIAAVREVASDTDSSTGLAFSVSQNDENLDEAVRIDHDGNVGIGETAPNRPLVVSETRTGSTASDAYTTVVKSVQSSGASPNPGTGGLKVQYTSSSSNVHAFGLVAGSSSSDFLTTGPMHFYTNSDLDTVSATGFAMQLDTSQRLILGSMTASQKLNVSGNVTADRYYGNGSTVYYIDPNDGTQSANLTSKIRVGTGSLNLSSAPTWGVAQGNIFASTDSTNGGTATLMNVSSTYAGGDASGTLQFVIAGGNTSTTGGGYATAAITAISRNNPGSGTSGGGNLIFKTSVGYGSVSEKMRLTDAGRLGIGVDPSSPLHVSGDIETTTGSVKIADNWGQGFYSAEQLSIVGTYPSIALRNNDSNQDNKWLIHHDGNDLTFWAGADHTNTTWAKKVQVDSGNLGMGAKMFYDLDSSGYYLDPGSSSVALNINGKIAQAKENYNIDSSHPNAIYQAVRGTETDRGTWPGSYYYGVNFGDRTKGIQLAAAYSTAKNLYFRSGTDNNSSENGANAWKNWRQLFHDDYHPNADKWTTARTITLGGDLSGSVSIDGSGDVTLSAQVTNNSHTHDDRYIVKGGSWHGLNMPGSRHEGVNAASGEFVLSKNNPNNGQMSVLIDGNYYAGENNGFYSLYSSNNYNAKSGFYTDSSGNTQFSTAGNYLQANTPHGYIQIGPMNTSYAHIYTNISGGFYFNKTGLYANGNTIWHAGNDGSGSGLDADLLDGQHGDYYALRDHIRSLGNVTLNDGTTTAAIISEIESFGGFDSYSSMFKASWCYACNSNLSDAGRLTELAGTSWLTWTDNSSDSTRGNITALVVAPNTGGSAGKMFVYNDQGSSYSPGWREIWTSTSDGSGSGLDADLLDGLHKTSFLYDLSNGDFRHNPGGSYSNVYLGHVPTSNTGSAFIDFVKQNFSGMPGSIRFYISPASTTNGTSSTYLKHLFEADGDAHHDGDVIAYSTSTGSDKKLKKNIRDLEGALDKTLKLRGVKFDWKDENKANDQLGFIAQEVESVIPEVVKEVQTITKDDETHLTVNYPALVPLLTEAIKEQQDQINELKTMLEKLTNQLNNGNNI